MSSYSTGTVGPSHRAVMHEGAVIAVAETVTLASVIVRALNEQEKGKEEAMQTMQPVKIGGSQVYIDLNCGETTSWDETDNVVVAEYGPIEEQGCDRCESGKARWVKVWAEQ